MSCELLPSSSASASQPHRYPTIIYHNQRWINPAFISSDIRNSNIRQRQSQLFPPNRSCIDLSHSDIDLEILYSPYGSTQTLPSEPIDTSSSGTYYSEYDSFLSSSSGDRRHTVDHGQVERLKVQDGKPGKKEKKHKLGKENSFKRKSVMFLKMFGGDKKKDEEGEDGASVTYVESTVNDWSDLEPTKSAMISEDEIIRSVSVGSSDEVVLRRAPGKRPIVRPITVMECNTTQIPSLNRHQPSIGRRPRSCYVKTPSTKSLANEPSAFQKRLRRFSASVKNFSLEKIMHQRKLSTSLREDSDTCVSEPIITFTQRKSLPPDFRYDNDSYITVPVPRPKVS